ncbi:hypothetical protein TRVL_01915 [Trypanosoma vivax]|nr:hypothetical protein TRVL_01915 [Trypanosoma vivax]
MKDGKGELTVEFVSGKLKDRVMSFCKELSGPRRADNSVRTSDDVLNAYRMRANMIPRIRYLSWCYVPFVPFLWCSQKCLCQVAFARLHTPRAVTYKLVLVLCVVLSFQSRHLLLFSLLLAQASIYLPIRQARRRNPMRNKIGHHI